MKDRLIFDTTNPTETDSVGAYLRASDGTLLTHTDVGGKKALDVRVAEGINVEIDMSHVDDSVRLGNGTDFFTSTSENSDIALDVHISNSSIVVTATDLDIRNLTQTDEITVYQGTNPWVIGDGGGSITVDAVNLDIRDLAAATDTVSAWTKDGTGTAITSTVNGGDTGLDVHILNSLTVNDAALANTAVASAANVLDVANTAENVVASPLANRKYLFIRNNGNGTIFLGATGVTSANGFPLSPGSVIEMRCGVAADLEWVAANTNQELRTLELS